MNAFRQLAIHLLSGFQIGYGVVRMNGLDLGKYSGIFCHEC